MEETERESHVSQSEGSEDTKTIAGSTDPLPRSPDLTEFADRIAQDVIKETITETNTVKIWSIPCSAGCHNSHQTTG